MTGLELLRSSLRLVGQLTPGRGPSNPEQQDFLLVFNQMIDGLSIVKGALFTAGIDQYPLSPAKATFTIGGPGIGADFDAPRPVRITGANLIVTSNPSQPLRIPVWVLDDDEWKAVKLQGVPSTLVTRIWCDYANPLATIHCWPVPTITSNLLELFTWQALVQLDDWSDDIVFPPGYAQMLTYQLAVRLAPQLNKPLRPDVLRMATDLLADVMRVNAPSQKLHCESITRDRWGTFNILTGEN